MAKALVLAGGGSRGAYQIGAWRALREMGWSPEIITGTSVGSLNGALLALDEYEAARDMWMQLDNSQVIQMPQSPQVDIENEKSLLVWAVANGGLDVSPLEQVVGRFMNEEKLRQGKIRFGLVTVRMKGGAAQQLTIDEIPQGKLMDYMLASAACYPAFKPREIDGEAYIDGGYYDNMPINLAVRMGADEVVAVDLEGLGLTKRPKDKTLKVTYVQSHWNLGSLLQFTRENSVRNLALGYLDTYRAFGKIAGNAYAFMPEQCEQLLQTVGKRLEKQLAYITKKHPVLGRAAVLATIFGRPRAKDETDKQLYFIELAAEAAGVEPTEIYTAEAFVHALTQSQYAADCTYELFAAALDPSPSAIELAKATRFAKELAVQMVLVAANAAERARQEPK